MDATAPAQDPKAPHLGHVAPVRLLLAVAAALLVLTVATVAVTKVDLGPFNLAVALVIALVKATLVALFFMHLWWDKPLNTFVFLASIAFVMLFILLATYDTLVYQKYRDLDHAPAIHGPE